MRRAPAAGVMGIAIAMSLCFADAQAAQRVATVPAFLKQGPTIAGSKVAWSESRCRGNCDFLDAALNTEEVLIRTVTPGRRPRTLLRTLTESASSGPNGFESDIRFAASDTRLAIVRTDESRDEFVESRVDTLAAGRAGGSLGRIFRCRGGSTDFDLPSTVFALTGDVLVYRPALCDGERKVFVSLDLRTGARQALGFSSPSTVIGLDAKGDFIGVTLESEGSIREYVVLDRSKASEAYRVAPPAGENIASADLQADGKAAVLTTAPTVDPQRCSGSRLAWYSTAEPFPHRLDVSPCFGAIAVTDDRIVFRSDRPRGFSVTDLLGRARLVANLGKVGSGQVDAGAGRATYGLDNCAGGTDILVQALNAPAHRAGPSACPLRIRSRRLRATAAGQTAVAISCPRGCAGRLRLRALDRRVLAERRFALQGRSRASVRLRLNVAGRRRLRRNGRLRVAVKTFTRDRTFTNRPTVRRAVLVRRG